MSSHRFTCLLLAALLIAAQALGYAHRIEHAEHMVTLHTHSAATADTRQQVHSLHTAVEQQRDDASTQHDCTLFDGATLSDGTIAAHVTPQITGGSKTHCVFPPSLVARVSTAHHFLSRAPPSPLT